MRFVIFSHSLLSDWNHGNAHFLRGVATELVERGHSVQVYESRNGWSLRNLVEEVADLTAYRAEFRSYYPHLESEFYDLETLDLERVLELADVVLVHEWNPHELVLRIGEHRALAGTYKLFFHDTHHRSVTDPAAMSAYDLSHYDGVLAYGGVIQDIYLENRWARDAWAWHEAADTRVFRPVRASAKSGDLVWIGNWGDGERTEEIREFLIRPVKALGLRARVYGVRYPPEALEELASAGIEYGGWLPNFRVPEVFAKFQVTVHIPRRPYVRVLPGIPTIRPFEALACCIPLISAPWQDTEDLFRPGLDFLFARDGDEMKWRLRSVLSDSRLSWDLAAHGLATIDQRHTCGHRVDELLAIVASIERCGAGSQSAAASQAAHSLSNDSGVT